MTDVALSSRLTKSLLCPRYTEFHPDKKKTRVGKSPGFVGTIVGSMLGLPWKILFGTPLQLTKAIVDEYIFRAKIEI